MNWEAIGASAAVAGLVVAIFQVIGSGLRSPLVFHTVRLQGKSFARPSNRLYATKFYIRNASLRHLANVRLRIHTTIGPTGAAVSQCDSIDENRIKISNEDNGIVLEFEDLPRLEKLEIDVFTSSNFLTSNAVKGGSGKYYVISRDSWLFKQIGSISFSVLAFIISLEIFGNV